MISWEAAREHSILSLSPQQQIEYYYQSPGKRPQAVLILAHPNPAKQGSMHSKALVAMAQAALQTNIGCLRFNFHGVGQTTGPQQEIKQEVQLFDEIVSYVKPHMPHIFLGGFSFGGMVALMSQDTLSPKIVVAPAHHYLTTPLSAQHSCNMIQCLDDNIVSANGSWQLFQEIHANDKKMITYGTGGHFFEGRLTYLQHDVAAFLQAYFQG